MTSKKEREKLREREVKRERVGGRKEEKNKTHQYLGNFQGVRAQEDQRLSRHPN